MSLLLLFFPQQGAAAAVGIDISTVIQNLLDDLNAATQADLVWWTADDLYDYADEAAKRLASRVGLFVERDTSITTAIGTQEYTLPARHISTVHASWGSPLVPLRAATVLELEALNTSWETDQGSPGHYVNRLGVDKTSLYKVPDAVQTLALVFHQFPPEIALATPTVTVPSPLTEWFSWSMLAEARRQEGDAAMPELAEHLDRRLALMEQVLTEYWGMAQ